MEVIFKGDLLVMKIKITYLILSPLVICYFGLILIFDLDHFFGDLPYLCMNATIITRNVVMYSTNFPSSSAFSRCSWASASAASVCSVLPFPLSVP